MASFSFRPSVLPTLGAVALIGLTLALANWQLNRAEQKRELQARLDSLQREPAVTIPKGAINASDFEFRIVEVVGEFEPRCTVYLDNKLRGHVPGYEIVTPVSVGASGKYVAVNRGWLAGTGDRSRLPPVPTPSGQVKVSGAAVIPSARIVELSNETVEDRLWQNLVLERYREWCRLDLAPFVIQQTNDFGDGLRREWPRPDLGIDMHRGYALQWFSLALLVAVLYVVLNVRRGPRRPG